MHENASDKVLEMGMQVHKGMTEYIVYLKEEDKERYYVAAILEMKEMKSRLYYRGEQDEFNRIFEQACSFMIRHHSKGFGEMLEKIKEDNIFWLIAETKRINFIRELQSYI